MKVQILMPDGRRIPVLIRARHYHKLFFLVKKYTIWDRLKRRLAIWKHNRQVRRMNAAGKKKLTMKKVS